MEKIQAVQERGLGVDECKQLVRGSGGQQGRALSPGNDSFGRRLEASGWVKLKNLMFLHVIQRF